METAVVDMVVGAAGIMRVRAAIAGDAAWVAEDIAAVVVDVAVVAGCVEAVVDAVAVDEAAVVDVVAKQFDEEKNNENKIKYYDFVETLRDLQCNRRLRGIDSRD